MITLKTLDNASAQEVFDQVKKHLLSQNERSTDGRYCRYRMKTFDNQDKILKCAAGCLIGDDEYKPDMEQCGSWSGLIEDYGITPKHKTLIGELQLLHDKKSPSEWESELKELAKRYLLKYENYNA